MVDNPPWRQPGGKWMVSLVNSHTNATSSRWRLWETDLRFALNSTPGRCRVASGDSLAAGRMDTRGRDLNWYTWKPFLSDTMYLSISFRKSTPPQNRQLHILIRNSVHYVDDFVGELAF